MILLYLLVLGVWLAWIFAQYQFGDRPTNYGWFVIMLGLGSFEYGKGISAMFIDQFTPALAGTLAVLTICLVVTYQLWRTTARPAPDGIALEGAASG
jgi:uncharacterized membrane protein